MFDELNQHPGHVVRVAAAAALLVAASTSLGVTDALCHGVQVLAECAVTSGPACADAPNANH